MDTNITTKPAPAKHQEFIVAVRNTPTVGYPHANGLVVIDRARWAEDAQSQIVIAQRNWLDNVGPWGSGGDQGYRQLLPYIVFYKETSDGLKFGLYRRTKKVGEERLGGNLSVGWGGHVELLDVGCDPDVTTGDATSVLSLGGTIETALNRELHEEVEVIDHQGMLHVVATDILIADDSNSVGRVHLGLLFVVKVQDEASVLCVEDELESLPMSTYAEIMARNVPVESWSHLVLDAMSDPVWFAEHVSSKMPLIGEPVTKEE